MDVAVVALSISLASSVTVNAFMALAVFWLCRQVLGTSPLPKISKLEHQASTLKGKVKILEARFRDREGKDIKLEVLDELLAELSKAVFGEVPVRTEVMNEQVVKKPLN